MMLAELTDLLVALQRGYSSDLHRASAAESSSLRDRLSDLVLTDNVLGKSTAASRRATLQRLSELYALDLAVPIYRVLHRLWAIDAPGRPLLALLCALARDPLLRSSATAVVPLEPGAELTRAALCHAIDPAPSTRFKPAILDKVARNVASSWQQSGHLVGRVRKVRRVVTPTAPVVAFALWLGSLEGYAGDYLLQVFWISVLDVAPSRAFELTLDAKRLGLLRAVAGGGVREIDVTGLDRMAAGR